MHASAVKQLAKEHGLPLLQPERLKSPQSQGEVFAYPVDVMVVAAYGLILPQPILDFPRLGCLNIHASLLPRWRGAAPIHRALLAGDTATGISIMQMDAGLDTGPTLMQAEVAIDTRDTAGTLHNKLAMCGAGLIVEALHRLRAGPPLTPRSQPAEGVTYAGKIQPSEAAIDWSSSAEQIDRQVRAFSPLPGAWTSLGQAKVKVWSALPVQDAGGEQGTVLAADKSGILVACGSGALRLLELQPSGSRRMTAQAFLAGHALRPGDRFAAGIS